MEPAGAASEKPPRGEARRTLILKATLRVIADEGLDAVTHRRVAEQAGISFGSITYWFDSRQELIKAAFRSYIDDASAFLFELAGSTDEKSIDDLADYLVEVARQEFADPRMLLAEYELILAAARDPELAAAFVAWERGLLGRLGELLEREGITRPFEAARTVLQLFRGAELDRLTRPEATDDELRRRLRSVISALAADAGGPSDPTTHEQHTGGSRARHAPARRR